MKKHMPKLLALVLTLLLTLALLPVPAAQAAAYDDPNFVVPAPSNLELSFHADGKCTIKFNNNLSEDFILSERFRMIVEIYDANTNQQVGGDYDLFYNWLYTGPVTEKTFNTNLGAGNYYAKLYNRLTVGGSSLAEKARSETVTSNTATLDPNAKVVYDIEFTRCKLNYQPGESPSINDYAVASGKPYSINGVVWNRYPADENGNPQASDCFWSSENLSISALTTFEKGYFYRCTVIFTTPKDGYSWAPSGLGASLNGEKLDFSPKVITGGIHLVQSGYLDLTSSKEITQAAVSGATLTLPASGLPSFTGSVPADADYVIDDEAWEDENGKFYTSNESKNAFLEANSLLFTEFTKGKTYTYSVTLKPKDSKHAFSKDMTRITFSFGNVIIPLTTANATLTNGYLTVDLLASYTIPDENTITNLVVEDATLTLVDGQAPKFTGHAPADADYELYQEGWEEVETGKYICNRYTTGLTAFEAGKTYSYCLYFLMKSTGKVFSPDAKDVTLTINGKQISAANLPYDPNTYLWEVHIDDSVVVTVVKSGESGGTSFIEPDYYPDYSENKDDAPAAAPAPAIPGRDESDTAPKTTDAPALPMIALAALSLCALAYALRRRAKA